MNFYHIMQLFLIIEHKNKQEKKIINICYFIFFLNEEKKKQQLKIFE